MMKKSIIATMVCCLLTLGFAEAGTERAFSEMKSRFNNVKVYAQASTSTDVVAVLKKDESVNLFRQSVLNGGIWSIVYIDGRPAYVLTAEIYEEPRLVTKVKKEKKNRKTVLSKVY